METQSWHDSFYRTFHSLLDLVFPPRCGGCNNSGSVLCSSCMAQFTPIPAPHCSHCGVTLSQRGECDRCTFHRIRLSGLHSAYTYQGPLRTCIHNLKYRGQTRLAVPLGRALADTYQAHQLRADMIIPVPLHPERQQERGYNQAQLLAQACAKLLQIPMNTSILQRTRATKAQTQTSANERYKNVADAFRCSSHIATKSLAKRIIIIIDDVCTTGATLEACAAPLFAEGASEVWGLVLARPL